MFCFAFVFRSVALAPIALAAAATVGPACCVCSGRALSSPFAPANAPFVESASWSGPKAPAPLDDSHRVKVYETASRTLAGTWNSPAALLKALCKEEGAALAEDPRVARTRIVLARKAETRAEDRGTCDMDQLLVVGVDLGAERLLPTTETGGPVCAPAT